MAGSYFAGLDIGGTSVKAILVDASGVQVGNLVEVPSRVKEGYLATFAQLEEALRLLAEGVGIAQSEIGGVGLDVPAPSSGGVIWVQANLGKDWVGTNIRDAFSQRIKLPVYMTNDGNAAAAGEYAARPNYEGGLLLVAPGTGLGGGLVLPGGTIYEGANGLALEVGHMSVPFYEEDGTLPNCSCGLTGCAEAWVSLVALRRRLGIELAKPEWADHTLNKSDDDVVQKAYRLRDFAAQGDPFAVGLFKDQGFKLGYAIADMVRLFDPGLVIIGGGLAETSFRDQYMDWVQEGFDARAWPIYQKNPLDETAISTRFEWASGGDSAAALGMAFVAQALFGK
ncbi:MAG: ROK family protein [Candidatus Latescibacterota bacterium]